MDANKFTYKTWSPSVNGSRTQVLPGFLPYTEVCTVCKMYGIIRECTCLWRYEFMQNPQPPSEKLSYAFVAFGLLLQLGKSK